MKNILSGLLLLVFLQVNAQPPSGEAKPGTVYGKINDGNNAISAGELPSLVKGTDTVEVKLKTTVNDVCSKKGCWLTFQVNDSTEAFVKMENYGFFVPLDLQGKNVVLEGWSFIKTTSVAELKHYAEDAGKSKKEVEAITSAKKEYRVIAKGILVVN